MHHAERMRVGESLARLHDVGCGFIGRGGLYRADHRHMRPREREATYDDILALPEHVVGEIVEGELFVSPRPASPPAASAE